MRDFQLNTFEPPTHFTVKKEVSFDLPLAPSFVVLKTKGVYFDPLVFKDGYFNAGNTWVKQITVTKIGLSIYQGALDGLFIDIYQMTGEDENLRVSRLDLNPYRFYYQKFPQPANNYTEIDSRINIFPGQFMAITAPTGELLSNLLIMLKFIVERP